MHCTIAVPSILDKPLTYGWPFAEQPCIGQIVTVPLKNTQCMGIVWKKAEESAPAVIKNAISTSSFILPKSYIEFLQKFKDYTVTPLGVLIKHVLPKALEKKTLETINYNYQPPVFTKEQQQARDMICKAHNFNVFVLEGVTGSGKTEIYTDCAMQAYQQGKQVLILLPEIALTAQFQERFTKLLGQKPLIWHSQITPKKRQQIWQTALEGQPCIILGARSALLLPFANLGFMVVDEEHDHSYKQEEVFLYHARDMAVLKAKVENIPIVLASATPSLESLLNAKEKRYHHVIINKRFGNAQLPTIEVLSLKGLKKSECLSPWIHPILLDEIHKTLAKKEQVLLFLNRRGYAPLTICADCGLKLMCPACDVALVQHRSKPRLLCHHCEFSTSIPTHCPKCQTENLYPCGPGVERLSNDLKKLLPDVSVLEVTSDLINTPKRTQEMVQQIQEQKADIIVATQMLTKGYHFPNITLVGVIDADMGLSGPDLRCAERTYQQLHQVAGRCGREEKPGKVYLQTYDPMHPVIEAVSSWNKDCFIELELDDRKIHGMPPFGRLTAVLVSGRDNTQVMNFCRTMLGVAPHHEQVQILGPVPAPLTRLKHHFRWRFLLKYPKTFVIQAYLRYWLGLLQKSSTIRIVIDIDPVSFS